MRTPSPAKLNKLTHDQRNIYRADIARGTDPATAYKNARAGIPVPGQTGSIGVPPKRNAGECPACGTVPACPPPPRS